MKILMTAASFIAAYQDFADGFAHPLQPLSTEATIEAAKDHSLSVSSAYTFTLERNASGRYLVEEPRDVNDPAYWVDKV
jgi:hypothetical protein